MASMHSLFNWAIQHTDENALHQSVANGTATNTIPKDLMEAILQTDAEKMGTLVKMYQDESTSLAEKEACLEELEFFVQIIDNANDLNHPSVNALKPLLDGLKNPQPTLRALCAFALGTALQNNPKVQIQVVQMNGLSELLAGFRAELSNPNYYSLFIFSKLLYALISLLDQNPKIQKEFRDASGFNLLHEIMSKPASFFDFPKPASTAEVKSEDNEEEEKPTEPGTLEVVDIVDRVKKTSKKHRELVTETAEQQYVRLIRRVIFLLLKLISQTEQFKLAFVKDMGGILVEDVITLATKYSTDFDVVDKTTLVLNSLISGAMKSYVISELKKWKPNLEHLLTLVEDKENLSNVLNSL